MYDVLPLYHTSGLGIAAGQMLVNGTTLVLRKKFSASNFSNDCFKHKCTVSNFFNGRFFFMSLKCILQRNHVQAIYRHAHKMCGWSFLLIVAISECQCYLYRIKGVEDFFIEGNISLNITYVSTFRGEMYSFYYSIREWSGIFQCSPLDSMCLASKYLEAIALMVDAPTAAETLIGTFSSIGICLNC